jgi:hypothetical protein
MLLQDRHDLFHIGFSIEQADNVGIAPQAGFTRQRLEYRRIVRILEGDGDRPASISASLRSSAFAPVVFSFSWIHGMAKLFIYQ